MLYGLFIVGLIALIVGIVLLVRRTHKKVALGALIGGLVVMFTTAPFIETEGGEAEANEPEPVEEVTKNTEESKDLGRPDEIEATIEEVAKDQHGVHIEKVTVNGEDENYIVLINVKWGVKNRAKTTREMTRMLSDELANAVAGDDISEITTFWEIPYHLEGDNSAKFNYDGEGKLTEEWFAPKLN